MLVRSALVSTATALASRDVDHAVRLGLGGVRDDDRDAEGAGLREVAVVGVALDDDDGLAFRHQPADHADSHRAEADDDDVVDHAREPGAGPATAQCAGSPECW